MRNTFAILTMRYAFVNDINQAGVVLIVLVDLSDKPYNDLDGGVWFDTMHQCRQLPLETESSSSLGMRRLSSNSIKTGV